MMILLVGIGGTGIAVFAGSLLWILKVLYDIRKDMHAMENRLTDRIGKVESSLGDRITKVENRLTDRIGKVESSLGDRITKMETDIAVLAERIGERTKALKGQVDDRMRENAKWTEKWLEQIKVQLEHKFQRPAPAKALEQEEREKVPA